MPKLKFNLVLILSIIIVITPITSSGQIEDFLPTTPILFVKFENFAKFRDYISNIILIMFPKSYEQNINSIKSFFEEKLFVDILEVSNLQSLGISTNKEFGFGFNNKGQAFIMIPIFTTNLDERTVKLQNVLYKLDFSSFTFVKDYLIATGKDFERTKNNFLPKNQYNVFISETILDSLTPFKVPTTFSNISILLKVDNIRSNKISFNIYQHPVILRKTNTSSKLENIPYVFQKDNVSIIFNVKLSPRDLIENITNFEKIIDIGIYTILSNFQKDFNISLEDIITNLSGPTTLFVYEYNNGLNNKIMFISPVGDQNSITRKIETIVRDIAKNKDIFKFTIFDKSFYRLPIKDDFSLYFGVIFNRFIVSSDKDILVGFVRNIANNTKELDISETGLITLLINSQPTLNNTIKISQDINPFIKLLLPIIIQSDRIKILSNIEENTIVTRIEIEY